MKHFDRIIIGGGLYGLYATLKSVQQGYTVLLLEKENSFFTGASSINQARVHCGMHYLRAYKTAKECALYYDRFINEHRECINSSFKALYANSALGSLTSDDDFIKIADSVCRKYTIVNPPSFIKKSAIGTCIQVMESTFDPKSLLTHYLIRINEFGDKVYSRLNEEVTSIKIIDDKIEVNNKYSTDYLLNCTYSNVNNIICLFSSDLFDIKYELCEVVLCRVPDSLNKIGLTIMDGPFCSIMPWGFSNYHTLTSVGHTPHYTCINNRPCFPCQQTRNCSSHSLNTCNNCERPFPSKFDEMNKILMEYLSDDVKIEHYLSQYTIKPTLKSSEEDDSRPTAIKCHFTKPYIYSILSGKISTIYELDSIL